MKQLKNIIHGKFQSIMGLAQKLETSPKKFGTDHDLSHKEIHLIEIIGDNDGLSVTGIATLLGITKGAVSQSLKRLEAKELSFKEQDPENLSRAIVKLTSKGYVAFWAHKHWHEKMDGGFAKYLDGLTEEKTQIIVEFLTRTEDFIKRRINTKE